MGSAFDHARVLPLVWTLDRTRIEIPHARNRVAHDPRQSLVRIVSLVGSGDVRNSLVNLVSVVAHSTKVVSQILVLHGPRAFVGAADYVLILLRYLVIVGEEVGLFGMLEDSAVSFPQ